MDQELIEQFDWTPLHCLVEKGNIPSIKNLLEQGSEINSLDKFNRTPLSIAASNGYFPIVKLLIDREANIDEGCPLHYSCEKGHLDVVKYLVEKGTSINSGQNPPLVIAICNDQAEVAKYLIEKGADINAINENNESALHCACDRGNVELVSILIEEGCQINVKDKWKMTPLAIALVRQEKKPELVKILLDNGASTKLYDDESALFQANHPEAVTELVKHGEDVDIQNEDGETPLYFFCHYNIVECAKQVLENGAKPNISTKGGWTTLHCAVAEADLDFIKLLLNCGANVNAASSTNVIPLHLAAERGDLDIVKELLKKGSLVNVPVIAPCDVNGRLPSYINDNIVEGATPFGLASSKGFDEVCEVIAKSNQNSDWPCNKLLEMVISNNLEKINNCDINHCDLIGWTALHHSVYRSYHNLTSLLLENEAPVNAKDSFDRTPLSLAVSKNDLKSLNLLLNKGADVNKGNALLYATASNSADCVKELVKRNCDVNAKTETKTSALFKASPEIMKILLENNANPNIVNAYGETPLHEMCNQGILESAKLLLDFGANVNQKDDCSDTPLLNSCIDKKHSINLVKLLLEKGANINDRNRHFETPLHYAASSEFEEATNELITAGALLDLADDEKETPLFICTANPNIVKKLAQSGADVNHSKRGGWTPLHSSVEEENQSFKELLKNGAKVNSASAEFVLPIYVASVFGFDDIVEGLIECGSLVDPYILHCGVLLDGNPPKRYNVIPGNTPLIGAASKGRLEVVKVLCKHGACVKAVNYKGNSALHEAVLGGFSEIVRFLLELDCGLKDVKNGEGRTPTDLAKNSRNSTIIELLA